MSLLEAIRSKVPTGVLASKDMPTIADAFNVGRVKTVSRMGGIGVVLETLGPGAGADLLDGLKALSAQVPALRWAWALIDRGELDFGSASTQGMIDMLTSQGAIPVQVAALLKAVAQVPDPVSIQDITVALIDDNGIWRI